MAGPSQIRVASIPSNHAYVRNLAAVDNPNGDTPDVDPVLRLADPPPNVPDARPGQWWPPVMLDSRWVHAHHQEFDVAHLHFGFDAADPTDLRGWVDELGRHNRPLVMTVHDLVNPHFVEQGNHSAHLDVLIPAATELITLTHGAAAAIQARWRRQATVIPHPHVMPLDRIPSAPRSPVDRQEFVIGLHAKNLRANIDPLPLLVALEAALHDLPDARVRVDLHPEVLSRADPRALQLREWLRPRHDDLQWQISVHPMFTDDELWEYLGSLDLCVLPYRFGTHSGWLEACVDLGTAALVPATGYYAEQHGHPSYSLRPDGTLDQTAFVDTIRRLRHDLSPARPPRPDRLVQRRDIAAAHEALYRRALGAGSHPSRRM